MYRIINLSCLVIILSITFYFLGGAYAQQDFTLSERPQMLRINAPLSGGYPKADIDICTSNVVSCNYIEEITKLANEYNFPADVALSIAECESTVNPKAINKQSSAKGTYQFIDKTWDNYCEGDVFNNEDNTRCFLTLYPQYPSWWECKI